MNKKDKEYLIKKARLIYQSELTEAQILDALKEAYDKAWSRATEEFIEPF